MYPWFKIFTLQNCDWASLLVAISYFWGTPKASTHAYRDCTRAVIGVFWLLERTVCSECNYERSSCSKNRADWVTMNITILLPWISEMHLTQLWDMIMETLKEQQTPELRLWLIYLHYRTLIYSSNDRDTKYKITPGVSQVSVRSCETSCTMGFPP